MSAKKTQVRKMEDGGGETQPSAMRGKSQIEPMHAKSGHKGKTQEKKRQGIHKRHRHTQGVKPGEGKGSNEIE